MFGVFVIIPEQQFSFKSLTEKKWQWTQIVQDKSTTEIKMKAQQLDHIYISNQKGVH